MDASFNLAGLIGRSEVKQLLSYPPRGKPSLGEDGKILVGAAVGTRDADKERVAELVKAGVNAGEIR